MKKIAIMQPYFLPYIGYWQLISAVDEFVVYDNIEFTKKGWFNRNRILDGDHDRLFTIPIKKDSDFLNVRKRFLSDDSQKEALRILRIIQNTYRKAPNYAAAYPIIESCFLCNDKNLFTYIYNSTQIICKYLDIDTKITISSSLDIDHSLKAEQKVLALCKEQNAEVYINAIGGTELYNKEMFKSKDIDLLFIKARNIEYKQYDNQYVPWLSITDIMMFNDKKTAKQMLKEFDLA